MSTARSEPGPSRVERHPVLGFERDMPIYFYFDGRLLSGYAGETIAAALVANGVKVFGRTGRLHRPRGFFCAIGKCSSCLMTVDGRPNVMVCIEPLRDGVRVESQQGRGRIG